MIFLICNHSNQSKRNNNIIKQEIKKKFITKIQKSICHIFSFQFTITTELFLSRPVTFWFICLNILEIYTSFLVLLSDVSASTFISRFVFGFCDRIFWLYTEKEREKDKCMKIHSRTKLQEMSELFSIFF